LLARRASDRMLHALAWMAPVLVVANLVLLYSPREATAIHRRSSRHWSLSHAGALLKLARSR
jgi:hypothetical protein